MAPKRERDPVVDGLPMFLLIGGVGAVMLAPVIGIALSDPELTGTFEAPASVTQEVNEG